jgi:ABC-type multidrug transport system ATPase subunit
MTVMSCGLDSGELDYKFPVFFADSVNVPPDISKTSKGQKQVIDFAFYLTVMLYLNLNDYPLFLDEPGEGFDEQHRVKLIDFVKQLMESGRHSQLFLISHYASGHGAFTNAEILVLDSSNISVPGIYNQHVTMA